MEFLVAFVNLASIYKQVHFAFKTVVYKTMEQQLLHKEALVIAVVLNVILVQIRPYVFNVLLIII